MRLMKLENNWLDKLIIMLNKYKCEVDEEVFKEDEILRLKKAIVENKIVYYIAIEGEMIIGCCSLTECFSSFKCKPMAIFEDFYIEKNHRGRGIAQELVNYVKNNSRDEGIDSIWVGSSENYNGMYKKLGFDMELGTLLTYN